MNSYSEGRRQGSRGRKEREECCYCSALLFWSILQFLFLADVSLWLCALSLLVQVARCSATCSEPCRVYRGYRVRKDYRQSRQWTGQTTPERRSSSSHLPVEKDVSVRANADSREDSSSDVPVLKRDKQCDSGERPALSKQGPTVKLHHRSPRRRGQQPKLLNSPEDSLYYNHLNRSLDYQGSKRKPRKLGQIKLLDGEDEYYQLLSAIEAVPEEELVSGSSHIPKAAPPTVPPIISSR
ncbi:myosin-IIIb-like [Puntigrus tetrazona]|uniref:myosin-IIIb-like n=1 Tax=Puntigrus tetrazona TaxID=1606681 RepID=UPI001C8A72FD|nr:myosin-IIIb-like [Puntigrus tetrazona]